MRPAWSEQFDPDVLGTVEVAVAAPVTSEWAWGDATGREVKVAVIDSGIEAGHREVRGVEGWAAFELDPAQPEGVRMVTGPHDDVFGHGTACAGIIRRVAPEVSLYSVRVLGTNLKTRGKVFAEGLRWAVDQEMDVVNLSLSSKSRDYFALFHELADRAYFANTVLVCAIANARVASYPSEYAAVVSVAANDETDPFAFHYNPRGPVEFGAPGIDVEVPWRGGTTVRMSGNSFAAAHLSGIAARILSKHPGMTPFQLKTVLQALARNTVQRVGATAS